MSLLAILQLIFKYLISHPFFLFKGWILNFLKDVLKSPILALLLMYFIFNSSELLFRHKHSEFLKANDDQEIEDEINLALNQCGNGSTIARIGIGTEQLGDSKVSFKIDTIRSCDKNLIKYREDQNCDLDVKWLNPKWKKTRDIDKRTLEILNQNEIRLGEDINLIFRDGTPIWLDIFNENGDLTDEGKAIKITTPKLFDILNSSKRTIGSIGLVKIRHPVYRHIVYLFTLSFWYNEYGEPERYCEHNKSEILRRLAKKQRQQLN